MIGGFAKYHFFKIIRLSLAITAIPLMVLWLTQAGEIFELLLTGVASAGAFFLLSLFTLPPVISHILPAGFLTALIIIFVRGHSDHSFLSLWAAGGKPIKLARPFLLTGVLFGMIALANAAYLAPKSSFALRQTLYSLEGETVRAFLKPGVFISPNEQISLFVRDIEDGGKIKGFFLQDKSEPEETRIFTAREAVFTGGKNQFLTLIEGKIVTLPRTELKKRSTLSFEKFTVDLTELRKKILSEKPLLKAQDFSLADLLNPPKNIPPDQQLKLIVKAHEYMSATLLPLAYALIICLFLLRPFPLRGGIVKPIFYAVGGAVGLKLLMIGIQNIALNNAAFIYLMYAVPVSVILVAFVYLLHVSRSRLTDTKRDKR